MLSSALDVCGVASLGAVVNLVGVAVAKVVAVRRRMVTPLAATMLVMPAALASYSTPAETWPRLASNRSGRAPKADCGAGAATRGATADWAAWAGAAAPTG